MDEPQSDRQRVLAENVELAKFGKEMALGPYAGLKALVLTDDRDEWDSRAGYIKSDSLSMCPSCRQIETMELAVGGNGFSEYKCSFCGQQVRLEDDE